MSSSAEVLIPETTKESVYEKVGVLFKEARESRHLTILQASKELHIRQLYIQAIESGDLSVLPGHVYKVGFIKAYAHFLNLDSNQVLKELDLQEDIAPAYSSFNYSVPVEQQKHPNLKIVLAATTLLFIGGGILYVTNNKNHLSDDVPPISYMDLTSTQTEEAVPTTSTNNQIVPKDQNEKLISDELTVSTSPESESNSVNPAYATTSGPKEASALPENKTVTIVATKDAWVQVIDETGKAIFVRLMRSGESYTIPSEGQFWLNTGNSAGVKLVLDGKSTPALGKDGKVMRGISLAIDDIKELIKD